MEIDRQKNDRICKFIESNALREEIYDSNLDIADLPTAVVDLVVQLEIASDMLNYFMRSYIMFRSEKK